MPLLHEERSPQASVLCALVAFLVTFFFVDQVFESVRDYAKRVPEENSYMVSGRRIR
jgi:hypothetical protein